MKQQAIQYLFIDVHQATCVASVRDEGGGIVMRATVATEARAILQMVRSAGPRVHVGFEEGTQAQWLHDLLVAHAEKVIACNTVGGANPATRAIGSTPRPGLSSCGSMRSGRSSTEHRACSPGASSFAATTTWSRISRG